MQTIDYTNSIKNQTGDIMAQSTVDKFVQAVNEDLNLIAKLKAAVDIESYYQIAAEHGYHFTPEELNSELSQQALEELAMKINPGMAPRQHINAK
jgi:predicted ribosomally synthesized peptide with nif11-like leader